MQRKDLDDRFVSHITRFPARWDFISGYLRIGFRKQTHHLYSLLLTSSAYKNHTLKKLQLITTKAKERNMTTPTARYSFLLLLGTLLVFLTSISDAFQPSASKAGVAGLVATKIDPTRTQQTTQKTTASSTQLYNLFGNLFGNQESSPQEPASSMNNNPVVDVFEIPTEVIKIKPLKFFLQIFFVGIQNTPFKGAWLLNANEEVEEYLEVYFSDGTGMLSVQFDDSFGLRIQRKGKRPSLQYMLQESVLLHSVLDELEAIAFGEGDGNVKDEERLLQFSEENQDVLARARAQLPARAAPEE